MRIITFAGMPGSGKSSAGRALAELLSSEGHPASWIDLDAEVERVAGKSIERIFAEDGEAAFRDLEKDCLRRLIPDQVGNDEDVMAEIPDQVGNDKDVMAEIPDQVGNDEDVMADKPDVMADGDRPSLVISLGGGTLEDPENLALVRDKTWCIWLDTPLEVIAERLLAQGDIAQRPLLRRDLSASLEMTEREALEMTLKKLYAARKAAYQAAAKEIR